MPTFTKRMLGSLKVEKIWKYRNITNQIVKNEIKGENLNTKPKFAKRVLWKRLKETERVSIESGKSPRERFRQCLASYFWTGLTKEISSLHIFVFFISYFIFLYFVFDGSSSEDLSFCNVNWPRFNPHRAAVDCCTNCF